MKNEVGAEIKGPGEIEDHATLKLVSDIEAVTAVV